MIALFTCLIPSLILGSIVTACAAESFVPPKELPKAEAVYTQTLPTITGNWSTSNWSTAQPIYFPQKNVIQRTAMAEVRLLWNESGLCVAFRAPDRSPTYGHFKSGEPLYQEDVFELFIDPVGDHRQFYEIHINPAGETYLRNALLTAPLRLTPEGRIAQDYVDSELWRYQVPPPEGFKAAAAIDAKSQTWSASLFIPAAFLNRRKGSGSLQPTTWRMNLAWNNWNRPYGATGRDVNMMCWAEVLPGHAHISPTLMGWLHLTKP